MTFALDINTDRWLANNLLPIPAKATPVGDLLDTANHFRLVMQQATHSFHPKLNSVAIFGYDGTYPGPTINAKSGVPIRVSWLNGLSGTSLGQVLDLGPRQGMEEAHMLTLPHNGVHLHGARVPWTSDGHPDRFYHPNEGFIAYYPNKMPGSTLWYHDHTMDVTRLNVYAGLFGLYFVRDPAERTGLPHGAQEIPLVLQDKSFSNDGTRQYYEQADGTPEFIGDYPLVNGKVWPLANLGPRIYRLRLCNGANTRIFALSICEAGNPSNQIPLWVIGTEGGFLAAPEMMSGDLSIAPGERYDVLIDLRGQSGKSFMLNNSQPSLGDNSVTPDFAELLKIDVSGNQVASDARYDPATIVLPVRTDPLPNALNRNDFAAIDSEIDGLPVEQPEASLTTTAVPMKLRRFVLEEYQLEMPTMPGSRSPTVLVNGYDWHTAPTVEIGFNDYEVWEFQNTTPDAHPMHVHLVQFQIVSRCDINIAVSASGDPDRPEPKMVTGYVAGSGTAPAPHEQGWKDTVQCLPGQATRIAMRFDGHKGDYVYHCHILEHEDMGMMYRIRVD